MLTTGDVVTLLIGKEDALEQCLSDALITCKCEAWYLPPWWIGCGHDEVYCQPDWLLVGLVFLYH